MMTWDLYRVFVAAVVSRALVLALGLASDWAVADYDTSARWDVPNTSSSCVMSDGDEKVVQKDPLARAFCRVVEDGLAWDSLHFLRIAQCGYETEKAYAFFPLLPGTMRGLQSTLLSSLMPALYPRCTLALAGYIVSNCAFVFAALVLLGCLTLRDGDMARRAAYLFCFNPASVFYSAVYSESLFAFLTFSGALSLALNRPNRAAIAFFASSAARSNGVLNCALLGWDCARRVVALSRSRTGRTPRLRCALAVLACAARCAFAVAPFFAFQLWGWYRFCGGGPWAGAHLRPWCTRRPGLIYTFVQEHYWDIGFLRYYRAEQLPNFALAAPMLAVTAAGVAAYWRADPRRVQTLGLVTQRLYTKPRELTALEQVAPMCAADQLKRMHAGELVPFGFPAATVAAPAPPVASSSLPPLPPTSPIKAGQEEGSALRRRRASSTAAAEGEPESVDATAVPTPQPPSPLALDADSPLPAVVLTSTPTPRPRDGADGAPEWGYLATPVLPFVAMWAAMALPAALVMHVQVATRFLSACPALYWFAAQTGGTRPALGRLLWAWSLLYAAIGTVLFVNFYPWT